MQKWRKVSRLSKPYCRMLKTTLASAKGGIVMSWQAKSAVEQEIEAFQQRLAESVALHQDVLRSLVQDRIYRDWEALHQPLPPHYSLFHRLRSQIVHSIHSSLTRKR